MVVVVAAGYLREPAPALLVSPVVDAGMKVLYLIIIGSTVFPPRQVGEEESFSRGEFRESADGVLDGCHLRGRQGRKLHPADC